MSNINFHIITLFTEAIQPYLEASIVGRAVRNKIITISLYQLRDFIIQRGQTRTRRGLTQTKDYLKADDRPYGGGPGMVLQAKPILNAVEKIQKKIGKKPKRKIKVILFGASGKQFTNTYAMNIGKRYTDIILIAGRYEGVDARVKKILHAEEVSIGPYVLTGGELPAAVVIDAVTRHIPGVLGKDESIEERRIASPEVYTRPEVLRYKGENYHVPKVLLSGNHQKIEEWKRKKRSKNSANN